MQSTTHLLPIEKQIDDELHKNVAELQAALFELLAALLLFLTAFISIIHGILRTAKAALDLLLWAVALLITFLYWLHYRAVSKSFQSPSHERR